MDYKWLNWARKIQALSQTGLAFTKDIYDKERYEELRNISVEIMSEYTNMDMQKVKDLFTTDTGYQTPKVDVRGVVFNENKILMVKEINDDKWALPGGFCDINLSPSENVVKEIMEESGYNVCAKKVLALFDMNHHAHPPQPYHYYKVFIRCEIVGGEARPGVETNNVAFFTENSLPRLSTARNTEHQIKKLFTYLQNPEQDTVFD